METCWCVCLQIKHAFFVAPGRILLSVKTQIQDQRTAAVSVKRGKAVAASGMRLSMRLNLFRGWRSSALGMVKTDTSLMGFGWVSGCT